MNSKIIHPLASNLWREMINYQDKILISGATGWFGKTALALCESVKNPLMLIGSKKRSFQLHPGGKTYHVDVWDESEIRAFKPTIFIDSAFITRGYASTMPLHDYISINEILMERSLSISSLDSVNTYLSYSSGAASKFKTNPYSTEQDDPYGYLKNEWESKAKLHSFQNADLKTVVIRPWSVSGIFVGNPEGYAFSDLISQARNNQIQIQSSNLVYRRFSSVEDLLSVALAIGRTSENSFELVESGGELIELQELAELIAKLANPFAEILRNRSQNNDDDLYFSDNSNWHRHCAMLEFHPMSLSDQIKLVSHNSTRYWNF